MQHPELKRPTRRCSCRNSTHAPSYLLPTTKTSLGDRVTAVAALDEERKDILAMLEATPSAATTTPRHKGSASSLALRRAASPFIAPLSPQRNMLDLDDEDWAPRKDSPTGTIGSGKATTPRRKSSKRQMVRVRSMLDIDDEDWAPRKESPNGETSASGAQSLQTELAELAEDSDPDDSHWAPRKEPLNGETTGSRPPSSQAIRSMLDLSPLTGEPIRSTLGTGNGYSTSYIGHEAVKRHSSSTRSAASSPTEGNFHRVPMDKHGRHKRSFSDAATRPASFSHRASSRDRNLESAYQFSGYLPSNPGGPVAPKRNTLAGRKASAMAEAVRGGTMSLFGDPTDRGRNNSISLAGYSTIKTMKSKSPAGRSILRNSSPHAGSFGPENSMFKLKDGRVFDMKHAYRRLSDASLAISGGGLSTLGEKKQQRGRASSVGAACGKNLRLQKDYRTIDGEDVVMDSSEEDGGRSVSDDDQQRGRRRNERRQERANSEGPVGLRRAKVGRQPQSQMAAAEEEREQVAANHVEQYKVGSLLDPEITVTNPAGERSVRSNRQNSVHPWTSFDEGASGLNTPVDSDIEQDFTDIKRAQKLSVNMTAVQSTPASGRSVRTIYRGDFAKMQQEGDDHPRRVRKYLVATDLSDEAAHALEWTVGTVLRDGDTLLAIYCVDEEVGISAVDGSPEEARLKEQAATVDGPTKLSVSTPILTPTKISSPLGPGSAANTHGAGVCPPGREKSKPELERQRAVDDITERVSRLLRKTKLQVKVVIEVVHCKSPKHLITEVIDYLQPTMVILGSRGQSQLKGVILGSFSNYLVTKSSVPVMVARKRLKKHNKYKRPAMRLANNLANPNVNSLAAAKID
ncbi:Usp family protein [Drepanopeziza brunnea f. sp. 'multigermtubi' MB_m1]|uniref:Usp family protein n=1 Tax=Marssonina brunnea f. sp. multigermtubi (strain MB_m1) TaxID=1072389 RepID=K1Y5L0_MARBU|nr:Usp family protein [Drepanopeziza brunnea f. sp. 'multigermtubi' MB_m1]EKD20489.1 Usp family protein [Drepanopeziza brunnea f. sp. 'multigermtubi' MB_m1]